MPAMRIAIAASFTAEPLADSLGFWWEKLNLPASIEFAPYDQVFQQLLDPGSLLSTNEKGINVVLVRPEDWQRYQHQDAASGNELLWRKEVERNARDLVEALRAATRRSAIPYLVCLCPGRCGDSGYRAFFQQIETDISCQLGAVEGVHVLSSQELLSAYPVRDYYDPDRDEIGHIPYTTEFFAALGTLAARKIHALRRAPYKVIVVDCDGTLWKGVCGEIGPMGIEIDPAHRWLQEFLVAQHDAGMLLCLASKNNEEDVEQVFQLRPEMRVKREHFVAWRVNWKEKSENLRQLAAELKLGLDGFIFIDDNPLECEQVKASCPQVLTLELPQHAENIPQFLKNVWAFDKVSVTEEDRRRTSFYQQNRERDRLRRESLTLEGFLAGLKLSVTIRPMTSDELPRVAQLTQRTNQFNSTSIRRTEDEIRQLCRSGEWECLSVEVSDRFGDYGLVGVVIFRSRAQALEVDTFLLSCRVLGRAVEQRMLERLGELAQLRSLKTVDVRFVPSGRNRPALEFLEAVGSQFKESVGDGYFFHFPAELVRQLSHRQATLTSPSGTDPANQQGQFLPSDARSEAPSELIREIATEFQDAESIVRAIRAHKGFSSTSRSFVPDRPSSGIEKAILESWSEVLGIGDVGPQDDFFALGGDSLLATLVVSRLRRTLGVRLSLRDLFENPKVSALAVLLSSALETTEAPDAPSGTGGVRAVADARKGPEKAVQAYRVTGPLLRRRQIQGPSMLSFAQQRWWFLNQWAPGTADHLSLVLGLKGNLDLPALERALAALVQRHEALRTTFDSVDGSPAQIIHPETWGAKLSIIDLRPAEEADRQTHFASIAEQQFRQPFDLTRDPMLRTTLIHMAEQDHILLMVVHHIAFDGWSRQVLLHELSAFYQAFRAQTKADLGDLPLRYADFAFWQRERMASGDLDDQLSYWKQQLAGAPAILDLPTDRPRPSVQDLAGAVHTRVVSSDLLSRLLALSREEGATLFMTLLAAFKILLSRYSGQQDIVVGTPVAGRTHPELELLIGCFINVLVLRTELSPNLTFRELLRQVRELALRAQDNQDIPFDRLVEEMEHRRELSHAPICQVLFALESILPAPGLPDLQVELREVDTRSAFYDLSLFVAQDREGLRLKFEYRTDLFDPATIERMSAHFEHLLKAIVAEPNHAIGTLPLLNEAERHQLLVEWNDTKADYPRNVPLNKFIEDQVERTPDGTALIYESDELTYRQLNARANQLANHLRKLGVGPEVLVGLSAERSIEMVVALLGIIKAGGAYLPLDPEYPRERLQMMVEDAKPAVLLTQASLDTRLPKGAAPVICLDRDWGTVALEDTANLPLQTSGQNAIYTIFTSGSTGKPKGVPNLHQGIVNRLLWIQDRYKLTANDRLLQKTPYSFDVSVPEFFWPLISGACLVLARPGGHKDPAYLVNLIRDKKITTIHFVPSMLGTFLEADGVDGCLSLRRVFVSGEALTFELQQRFFERLHAELSNLYGPTEASVEVTYWPCRPDSEQRIVPIGRPIANTEIYILDALLQPVPIGVAGELHIGGVGLARGYLNRPDLTGEKFILNPYGREPGARLYKTGDVARFLPDGNIEYLGRTDSQVKLRGFRVELGEIEAVLTQHPRVQQAVATVREEAPGDKRLVAYVVPSSAENLDSNQLREHLKDRLPEFMVPSNFVVLERFPTTTSGKIDRRRLPAPDRTRPELKGVFVAPRTPLEEEVAASWREVLRLFEVGVDDNFFDVGGNSLLATRVIIILRGRLGVDVSVRLLFENPTVAGMASALMETLLEHADQREMADLVDAVEAMSDEEARRMRAAIYSAGRPSASVDGRA